MDDLDGQRLMRAEKQINAHLMFEWTAAQKDKRLFHIRNARGCWFENHQGQRFMDLCSSQFNLHLGYQHPKVIESIREQLLSLSYAPANAVFEAKGELLERLTRILPDPLDHFFLTLGGADATENALKIAQLVTGRGRVVARYRSYHGATLGALSASGDPRRNPFTSRTAEVIRILDPFCAHCPFGQIPETCHTECVRHVEEVIRYSGPETIAAMIVEPITCSSGVFVSPKDYLSKLRSICSKYGILLIFDEVATGFGRTGRWFAGDHWGVVPDLMILSKGLTNCYAPLGVVAMTSSVAEYFYDKPFVCGLTAGGHPLGCAAAVACLEVYESEQLQARANRFGAILAARLRGMMQRFPRISDVRSVGLLGVIEIGGHDDPDDNPGTYWNRSVAAGSVMQEINSRLQALGIATVSRWNWVFTAPPLTISETELRLGLDLLEEALDVK